MPFILDIIALIDISTLKFSKLEVRVSFFVKIRLFDTDAKDKADVAGLALSGSSLSGEIPRLEGLRKSRSNSAYKVLPIQDPLPSAVLHRDLHYGFRIEALDEMPLHCRRTSVENAECGGRYRVVEAYMDNPICPEP